MLSDQAPQIEQARASSCKNDRFKEPFAHLFWCRTRDHGSGKSEGIELPYPFQFHSCFDERLVEIVLNNHAVL